METKIIAVNELTESDIEAVVNCWRQGRPVLVPTETVYGIACAMDEKAFLNLYYIKQRLLSKPLPVLIYDLAQVEELCEVLPASFWPLAKAFWPGPLTMVLPKKRSLNYACLAPTSIALRFSSDELLNRLAKAFGAPLFLSSANLSGTANITQIMQAYEVWQQQIPLYLDAGPLLQAVPSTIIDLTTAKPKILRQGAVAKSQLEAVLNIALD